MKIGTYNILHPEFAVKYSQREGINANKQSNWIDRRSGIFQNIQLADLDVICLQEIGMNCLNDLRQDLEKIGYAIVNEFHQSGDGVAILYKRNKYTNLTPDYSKQCLEGRVQFYIDLQDKATQLVARVATCHLRGGGPNNGIAQIQNLKNLVKSPASYPLHYKIIAGDFNEHIVTNPKITLLTNDPEGDSYELDRNFSITENPSLSYPNGRAIDWIFLHCINNKFTLTPIDLKNQNYSVSDHRIKASQIDKVSLPVARLTPSTKVESIEPIHPVGSFRFKVLKDFEQKYKSPLKDENLTLSLLSSAMNFAIKSTQGNFVDELKLHFNRLLCKHLYSSDRIEQCLNQLQNSMDFVNSPLPLPAVKRSLFTRIMSIFSLVAGFFKNIFSNIFSI